MKKKFFIGIAMSLFAVATVFNMNIAEQSNAGDVSLDAIEVMAQATASEIHLDDHYGFKMDYSRYCCKRSASHSDVCRGPLC